MRQAITALSVVLAGSVLLIAGQETDVSQGDPNVQLQAEPMQATADQNPQGDLQPSEPAAPSQPADQQSSGTQPSAVEAPNEAPPAVEAAVSLQPESIPQGEGPPGDAQAEPQPMTSAEQPSGGQPEQPIGTQSEAAGSPQASETEASPPSVGNAADDGQQDGPQEDGQPNMMSNAVDAGAASQDVAQPSPAEISEGQPQQGEVSPPPDDLGAPVVPNGEEKDQEATPAAEPGEQQTPPEVEQPADTITENTDDAGGSVVQMAASEPPPSETVPDGEEPGNPVVPPPEPGPESDQAPPAQGEMSEGTPEGEQSASETGEAVRPQADEEATPSAPANPPDNPPAGEAEPSAHLDSGEQTPDQTSDTEDTPEAVIPGEGVVVLQKNPAGPSQPPNKGKGNLPVNPNAGKQGTTAKPAKPITNKGPTQKSNQGSSRPQTPPPGNKGPIKPATAPNKGPVKPTPGAPTPTKASPGNTVKPNPTPGSNPPPKPITAKPGQATPSPNNNIGPTKPTVPTKPNNGPNGGPTFPDGKCPPLTFRTVDGTDNLGPCVNGTVQGKPPQEKSCSSKCGQGEGCNTFLGCCQDMECRPPCKAGSYCLKFYSGELTDSDYLYQPKCVEYDGPYENDKPLWRYCGHPVGEWTHRG